MSLFQTFLNLGKINLFRKSLKLASPACNCLSVRNSSDDPKKFVSFDEVVEQRRAEAKRSVVVQVNSEKSFSELHGYCSKYASIKGMHHYRNSSDEHYILIEFTTEEDLKDVIKACSTHQKDSDTMALQSPFLWFRAADKRHKLTVPKGASLITEHADMVVDEDALYESLMNCSTVSEQIQKLYEKTALNDVGVRLRYLVARQIESLFEGMYANVAVQPFGSSVNGFGKLGCDLDLVLTNVVTEEMSDPSHRLVFQEKRCEGGLRPWTRHMELASTVLELRAAGVGRVARVPARVPIVQCAHRHADLEVDLCYTNMSGVYMSELLWLLGGMDPRVRPLVFAVRRWAQAVGLTNPNPGRWITNFPLTLLVLFHLQQSSADGSVLPPVSTLLQHAGKEDMRMGEDNVNCTFLRSAPLPPHAHVPGGGDLHASLLDFLEFYAQFDFQDKAISITSGTSVRKPNAQPLYIVNPLEHALNVSKNVSPEECARLKAEVRNAAWQLESDATPTGEGWGLLALVEPRSARGLKRLLRAGNSHRLVSVKELFADETSASGPRRPLTEPLRDKLIRLGQNSHMVAKELKTQLTPEAPAPPVAPAPAPRVDKKRPKFKNSQVASEVYRIRRNKIV